MPYSGTGVYSPPAADFPAVTLTTIGSVHYNNVVTDQSTAMSNAVTRDGQSPWTANLPAGNFKITGLGSGSARTDSANIGNLQDSTVQWVVAGGTVDAITATYTPAITALVDGQLCSFRAIGANTTNTPTFAPNGLTARNITKMGGSPLLPGDIPASLAECLLRYNLANTRWELLNAANLIYSGNPVVNGKIVRSVAASALTVALKDLAGNDPSATSPVYVVVPTQTGGVLDGGFVTRKVAAALSMVLSSGSTAGHTSAVASPIYTYLIDNAGVLEMANSTKFFGYASVQSSTTEGGAGAADTSTALYSTTARASMVAVCVQRWKSTQTVAGTWAATTGEVQLAPFPYKTSIITKITAAGANTYPAPWDMIEAEIKITGGGAAGGGSAATGAGQVSIGSGGGSGGTAITVVSAAVLTGNNTVTVGAKGTGSSGANGTAGGNSSIVNAAGVTLAAATGGAFGQALAAAAATGIVGGAPGIGTTGDILLIGNGGLASNGSFAASIFWAGYGGASFWGGGAMIGVNGSSGGASASVNAYGAGGSGALTQPSAAANAGGPGADGIYVITERY